MKQHLERGTVSFYVSLTEWVKPWHLWWRVLWCLYFVSQTDGLSLFCVSVFFFSLSLSFMYHGTRADINECEQVPKPCAHQCSNSPGSFKCICLPGQHLLGDGKSCAGLERLSNYGTQDSSYNLERFSPVRSDYQPLQHYRQYSHLYRSYSEYRNSRASFSRNRRTIRKTCPEGSEANHETCVGKCQPYCPSFLWAHFLSGV